jgi:hypothetical protein
LRKGVRFREVSARGVESAKPAVDRSNVGKLTRLAGKFLSRSLDIERYVETRESLFKLAQPSLGATYRLPSPACRGEIRRPPIELGGFLPSRDGPRACLSGIGGEGTVRGLDEASGSVDRYRLRLGVKTGGGLEKSEREGRTDNATDGDDSV